MSYICQTKVTLILGPPYQSSLTIWLVTHRKWLRNDLIWRQCPSSYSSRRLAWRFAGHQVEKSVCRRSLSGGMRAPRDIYTVLHNDEEEGILSGGSFAFWSRTNRVRKPLGILRKL
jgi:hypothetical protein